MEKATTISFHEGIATGPVRVNDISALYGSLSRLGFLLPSRDTVMLRWALDHGLRTVQQSTLMTAGLYSEPRGHWLPSMAY